MSKLNPFRVSFDRPLGSRERLRARIAATLVTGAAIAFGAISGLALLNASSGTISHWSNGKPQPQVRLLASEGEDPSGISCDELTWPYLQWRCLKRSDPNVTERSTPKHGLASQQIALPPARGGTSSAPAKPAAAAETTGSATPADTPDTAEAMPAASVPRQLTKREQREEQKRLQRERRDGARRLRDQRVKARPEARRAKRGERTVRGWTEYIYEAPSGGSRRIIVIRRGALDDDLYRTMR